MADQDKHTIIQIMPAQPGWVLRCHDGPDIICHLPVIGWALVESISTERRYIEAIALESGDACLSSKLPYPSTVSPPEEELKIPNA